MSLRTAAQALICRGRLQETPGIVTILREAPQVVLALQSQQAYLQVPWVQTQADRFADQQPIAASQA